MVPQSGRNARGTPIVNLVQLDPGDDIAAVISVTDLEEDVDLVFCSRKGLVKRTRLAEYKNLRSNGMRSYDCAEGDELIAVKRARTEQHVMIVTRKGMCIRFPGVNEKGEMEVRHMGRIARGVRGLRLREDDSIAQMLVLEDDTDLLLLTITENGFGKRTPLDQYRVQGRGGSGIINIHTGARNGDVAGSMQVHNDDRVMMITDTGRVIKCPVINIRESGRNTKGVTIMRIGDNERIVSVARVIDADEDELGEE